MTVLHFGVTEIPYQSAAEPEKKGGGNWKHNKKPSQTSVATVSTGDVAGWLENKYGVMQWFYFFHSREVMEELEKKAKGALESAMLGAHATFDPFADFSAIEQTFRNSLDRREYDYWIKGVPTQAARDGVNSRLKLRFGPERPSFIDTGLYRQSFKVWLDR